MFLPTGVKKRDSRYLRFVMLFQTQTAGRELTYSDEFLPSIKEGLSQYLSFFFDVGKWVHLGTSPLGPVGCPFPWAIPQGRPLTYRVTALSENILYLDSLETEGVNLRGCMFYMKMLRFFRSFKKCKQNFSIFNINDAMPGRIETRHAISALLDVGKRPIDIVRDLGCGRTLVHKVKKLKFEGKDLSSFTSCLLYTSPSPRDRQKSRMPSSA